MSNIDDPILSTDANSSFVVDFNAQANKTLNLIRAGLESMAIFVLRDKSLPLQSKVDILNSSGNALMLLGTFTGVRNAINNVRPGVIRDLRADDGSYIVPDPDNPGKVKIARDG
jgi:hypothetical protein